MRLDLDVCVPEWMRENFKQGIYPTLEQRATFAGEAAGHVESRIAESESTPRLVVISFSFVNDDLRAVFRTRFPAAQWFLMDTAEEDAEQRIAARQGHFYSPEAAAAARRG
eukprot:CAMPEP_0197930110 /NCGR_PEP_ID=MMETSP1439-20131203/104944_1 /TAXON_ID=66791 /ORGANISM="Gonyaulax spinifera, Strain CCMP409" /LENGTH=110 /DNA_ID=CAMNT_0043552787 /DNA_START=21 /DNA_END=349 /DNA_ORIENTATION=-